MWFSGAIAHSGTMFISNPGSINMISGELFVQQAFEREPAKRRGQAGGTTTRLPCLGGHGILRIC
ncbi:MAG: hypothetical protein CSA33_04460 [Desulfobulbus propionicus]|nr:MAG: hypothetical protein CSA33_04460 [Desulfobulbus propionicus]